MSTITLDVTDIETRGWGWSISSPIMGNFAAYVHFEDYSSPDRDANPELRCVSGWGDTPQAALDAAYRKGADLHCARPRDE